MFDAALVMLDVTEIASKLIELGGAYRADGGCGGTGVGAAAGVFGVA